MSSDSIEKPFITDIPKDQFESQITALGLPKFRANQIRQWVYEKRVSSFDDMNNLPLTLRDQLKESFRIGKLTEVASIESVNGDAVKFGFHVGPDDHIIETVLLIDGKRRTLCVSTQVGCALACVFCKTGSMGLIRNLSVHEITGQILAVNDYLTKREDKTITNIVFMGMGEALSNYKNFITAIGIITDENFIGIGGRRITVSTAGVVPSIEKFIKEDLNVGLAISLNTFSNAKRDLVMPINKKFPIEVLIDSVREFAHSGRGALTFEYVVIEGENDTDEAVDALTHYLKGLPTKVNLIPLNPNFSDKKISDRQTFVDIFGKKLVNRGLTVTVRKSRGRDISGACGQLAGKYVNGRKHLKNTQG